ncbi:MAG: hypothetical protein GY898_29305 [Proteobacteria bacterium]|nr:hypothetical protein [Pseudomonadota bacterium]
MAEVEAAILWWNPSGTGAVETDDRRHLRFEGASLPFTPHPGDKVLVTLDADADTVREQITLAPLPGGRRERVAVEEVFVEPALDSAAEIPGRIRPIGVEAPKLVRTDVDPAVAAVGGGRRRGPHRKYPECQAGQAFAVGQSVHHPTWGQGFVEVSTTRVARVKFSGQERQVRVAELKAL